jgi:hypothetical protein
MDVETLTPPQPPWLQAFPESIRHRCGRCAAWVVLIKVRQMQNLIFELEPAPKGRYLVAGQNMRLHMNCDL